MAPSLAPVVHVDSRLQQLIGDVVQFWADPAARARMLREMLDAFLANDRLRLDAAVHAVDDAVTAGMRVLGFTRGPVRAIRVRTIGALGEKWPTCELDIDAIELYQALQVRQQPDSVVETWLHESAHARRAPWANGWRTEYRGWPGYEEGLAEAASKEIARLTGLGSGAGVYRRYRAAYDLLADALGLPRQDVFQSFWHHENGAVRQAFTDVVDALYHQTRGRNLTLQERREVQSFADDLFDGKSSMLFAPLIEQQIRQGWQMRLP